jgi:DNA invertase Pin-like site-specific DNA recombinase
LPKNLRYAVSQLSGGELNKLYEAAFDEAKRRGRLPQTALAPPPPRLPPTEKRRQADADEVALTRGQVNAIRAAFNAGITPSRIVRQFGISQSNVRKALATDISK